MPAGMLPTLAVIVFMMPCMVLAELEPEARRVDMLLKMLPIMPR